MTTVTLPGRDHRSGEDRVVDIDECVQMLCREQEGILAEPHILLGHSLGAVLAYSIAHQQLSAGSRGPEAVIAAACRPPGLGPFGDEIYRVDDAELATELVRHGGLPAKVLTRPEWLRLLVPTVRDDLQIQRSFGDREVIPLPCPLHIFAGSDDELVSPAMMAEWARYSVRPQPPRVFDGGHFLFRRPTEALVTALVDIIYDHTLPIRRRSM